jgi:Ubiquinol-cytochrome C chaperone
MARSWHRRDCPVFIANTVSQTRSVNGRFDLLILHLAIVLDRLVEDSELRDMGQALFDRFCEDMDDNLREIGVGDLSVPQEMQRIGEAFYGACARLPKRAGLEWRGSLGRGVGAEHLWRRGPRAGCANTPCSLCSGSGT